MKHSPQFMKNRLSEKSSYIDTNILVTYYPKHALAPCNFVAMPVVHNYAVRKNVVRLKI